MSDGLATAAQVHGAVRRPCLCRGLGPWVVEDVKKGGQAAVSHSSPFERWAAGLYHKDSSNPEGMYTTHLQEYNHPGVDRVAVDVRYASGAAGNACRTSA